MRECECDSEHSVTKLGHCIDCPHYRRDQATQLDVSLTRHTCATRDGHVDGTDHDFDWATYADETTATGVCRCGLWELDFDMGQQCVFCEMETNERLRKLASNISFAAALCRSFTIGGAVALDAAMGVYLHQWRPGCQRPAP